jgi:hypothetical protein
MGWKYFLEHINPFWGQMDSGSSTIPTNLPALNQSAML